MNQNKIVFFCVGTGGHVLPVINLIDDLIQRGIEKRKIEVVTDRRGSQYFKDRDINVHSMNIYRSKIGIIGYVLSISKIIKSIQLIENKIDLRNCKLLFTTGSYIAPLAGYISWRHKIKFFIQEQNIYAGLGNKIASYFKSDKFTSYPNTININQTNLENTGPIVDKKIQKYRSKNDEEIVIGVQGGSQGSEEINSLIYKYLSNNTLKNIKIIHIVGPNNFDKSKKYENYKQIEFIENMSDFYSSIDLQVSRAGGGVLEAVLLNIPLLLIPYKHGTTSTHQSMNAEFLVKSKYAKLCLDYESLDFELKKLEQLNYNLFEKFSKNNVIKRGNDFIVNKIINELDK